MTKEKTKINNRRLFVILFIFLFSTFAVFAQDEDEISVEANLVNLSVGVTDGKGKYVEGLQKDQFEIFDNGIRQDITHFSAADAPVSYGIVYDMHPTTDERTTAVLESLREFYKGLKPEADLFTITFNRRGSLVLDFVPTSEQVETNLSGKYSQPNALYDAIFLGAEKLSKSRNLKRVLFVITDSADHNSEHKFGDIVKKMKTFDAQIYSVLWDESDAWKYRDITRGNNSRIIISSDASELDRAALQELALRTGGSMRSPTAQNAQELFRIYRQIAFETGKQYTLGFYPEKSDGKWHDIKIKLRSVEKSKKMALTYRTGYQSQ
jgi:Ca-activated chloride channel family protein